ncbi:MAG: phenylalanine--tRNA ligase alpha subunit [Candidatus Parcubacteria bacterium]|nr:MAG: phenylalanine--tRNA ligase alpha subunit [Candidatus Parcubacteria bacterium]
MKEQLDNILKEAQDSYYHIKNLKDLENFRIKFLGRNGLLASLSSKFKDFPLEVRKEIGQYFNFVKEEINNLYLSKKEFLITQKKIFFDLSHPGEKIEKGRIHLISKEILKIKKIFSNLGFNIEEGRELVSEKENFDLLNIPPNHPSRDLWDTFWINKKEYLLRTHTSAHQVEYLLKYKPPVKFIVIGKVYRHEATDQRHEMQFHQIEGVSVGLQSNLSELKSVFQIFFENYFNKKIEIVFRNSYFPFTEPSLEVDISCVICKGKGCSLCKKSGYLEIAGAGMIHPYVLQQAKININKYYGYAFGIGLERIIMLKFNIPDVRLFHSMDLRFINQF